MYYVTMAAILFSNIWNNEITIKVLHTTITEKHLCLRLVSYYAMNQYTITQM